MTKILVVCASRDRNLALMDMIRSVRQTAANPVEIAVYVDEDQRQDYAPYLNGMAVRLSLGPRIGPVASLNRLVELNPGFDAYGAATDDCEFTTRGWDRWVREVVAQRPGPLVLAPYTRGYERMDFPWATREWIEALGWFAYPRCKHFYWDVLLEILGEQAEAIARASRDEFTISHDLNDVSGDLGDKLAADALATVRALALERPKLLQKLRQWNEVAV